MEDFMIRRPMELILVIGVLIGLMMLITGYRNKHKKEGVEESKAGFYVLVAIVGSLLFIWGASEYPLETVVIYVIVGVILRLAKKK